MNAETFETTVITSEANVDTDSTISLFQALENLYPLATIIYLILDNAKYHFSGRAQEYVNNSRIQLIFLPSYSPELNLIEILWKRIKYQWLDFDAYRSFQNLKGSLNFVLNNFDEKNEIKF